MKKSLVVFLSLMALIFVLSGCSSAEKKTPDNQTTENKSATNPIVLKAVTFTSPTAFEDSIIVFKKYVEKVNEAAKGELKIEIIGGPEAIPANNQAEAVSKSVVDMVMTITSHEARVPEVNTTRLSEITPWEERETGYFDYLDKAHQTKMGLKVVGRTATDSGFYIYSKNKIEKLSDLKGMQIRSHAGYAPVFKKLGMVPVAMGISEIYNALERGVVDAAPYSAFSYDLGLYQVAKYVLDHNFWKAHTTLTYMNLEKFNSLPEHLQKILTETAAQTERDMVNTINDLKKQEREKLTKEGVQFIKLSPEEEKEFIQVTLDAKWEEMLDGKELPKEEVENMRKMISK